MTDIVERLRAELKEVRAVYPRRPMIKEAADEIVKWREGYERLWLVLLTVPCPGGGYTGMPAGTDPTVAACLAAGVCGCSYGDALKAPI